MSNYRRNQANRSTENHLNFTLEITTLHRVWGSDSKFFVGHNICYERYISFATSYYIMKEMINYLYSYTTKYTNTWMYIEYTWGKINHDFWSVALIGKSSLHLAWFCTEKTPNIELIFWLKKCIFASILTSDSSHDKEFCRHQRIHNFPKENYLDKAIIKKLKEDDSAYESEKEIKSEKNKEVLIIKL